MRNKEQNFEEIKAKLSKVDYFILGFSTAFALVQICTIILILLIMKL